MVMGAALLAVSQGLGGSDAKDFLSGLLLGIAVVKMLVGIFVTARSFAKK